jgi:hypothetical protein
MIDKAEFMHNKSKVNATESHAALSKESYVESTKRERERERESDKEMGSPQTVPLNLESIA